MEKDLLLTEISKMKTMMGIDSKEVKLISEQGMKKTWNAIKQGISDDIKLKLSNTYRPMYSMSATADIGNFKFTRVELDELNNFFKGSADVSDDLYNKFMGSLWEQSAKEGNEDIATLLNKNVDDVVTELEKTKPPKKTKAAVEANAKRSGKTFGEELRTFLKTDLEGLDPTTSRKVINNYEKIMMKPTLAKVGITKLARMFFKPEFVYSFKKAYDAVMSTISKDFEINLRKQFDEMMTSWSTKMESADDLSLYDMDVMSQEFKVLLNRAFQRSILQSRRKAIVETYDCIIKHIESFSVKNGGEIPDADVQNFITKLTTYSGTRGEVESIEKMMNLIQKEIDEAWLTKQQVDLSAGAREGLIGNLWRNTTESVTSSLKLEDVPKIKEFLKKYKLVDIEGSGTVDYIAKFIIYIIRVFKTIATAKFWKMAFRVTAFGTTATPAGLLKRLTRYVDAYGNSRSKKAAALGASLLATYVELMLIHLMVWPLATLVVNVATYYGEKILDYFGIPVDISQVVKTTGAVDELLDTYKSYFTKAFWSDISNYIPIKFDSEFIGSFISLIGAKITAIGVLIYNNFNVTNDQQVAQKVSKEQQALIDKLNNFENETWEKVDPNVKLAYESNIEREYFNFRVAVERSDPKFLKSNDLDGADIKILKEHLFFGPKPIDSIVSYKERLVNFKNKKNKIDDLNLDDPTTLDSLKNEKLDPTDYGTTDNPKENKNIFAGLYYTVKKTDEKTKLSYLEYHFFEVQYSINTSKAYFYIPGKTLPVRIKEFISMVSRLPVVSKEEVNKKNEEIVLKQRDEEKRAAEEEVNNKYVPKNTSGPRTNKDTETEINVDDPSYDVGGGGMNENFIINKLKKLIMEEEEEKTLKMKSWDEIFTFQKTDEKNPGRFTDVKIKMDSVMDRMPHWRKKYKKECEDLENCDEDGEDDSFVRAVIDTHPEVVRILFTKGLAHLTSSEEQEDLNEGLHKLLSLLREAKNVEVEVWSVYRHPSSPDKIWSLVKGDYKPKELASMDVKPQQSPSGEVKKKINYLDELKKKEFDTINLLSVDEKKGLQELPIKVRNKVKEKIKKGWTTEKPSENMIKFYKEDEVDSVFADQIKVYKLKPNQDFFNFILKSDTSNTKRGFCRAIYYVEKEFDLTKEKESKIKNILNNCQEKFEGKYGQNYL